MLLLLLLIGLYPCLYFFPMLNGTKYISLQLIAYTSISTCTSDHKNVFGTLLYNNKDINVILFFSSSKYYARRD